MVALFIFALILLVIVILKVSKPSKSEDSGFVPRQTSSIDSTMPSNAPVGQNLAQWNQEFNKSTIYLSMTKEQKMAAIHLMYILSGAITPSPAAMSKVNSIISTEARSMGLSVTEAKNFSGHSIEDIKSEICKINNRDVTNSLFVSYMKIVLMSRHPVVANLLSSIYEGMGYTLEEMKQVAIKDPELAKQYNPNR